MGGVGPSRQGGTGSGGSGRRRKYRRFRRSSVLLPGGHLSCRRRNSWGQVRRGRRVATSTDLPHCRAARGCYSARRCPPPAPPRDRRQASAASGEEGEAAKEQRCRWAWATRPCRATDSGCGRPWPGRVHGLAGRATSSSLLPSSRWPWQPPRAKKAEVSSGAHFLAQQPGPLWIGAVQA